MSIEPFHEYDIPSSYSDAKVAEDCIIKAAIESGYDEDDIFSLRLSLEEALSNAIRHGNVKDQSKRIKLRYLVNNERIDIYITDEGEGFIPSNVPDPTAAENLVLPNGRGIMLMRAYMNLVEYNETGNMVHFVKLKQGETGKPPTP